MPAKVFIPSVHPGIVQAGQPICVGIEPGQVAAFPQITLIAGESEVFHLIAAPVFRGDDVFNMERAQPTMRFGQKAILAPATRPVTHRIPREPVHYKAPLFEEIAGLGL